MTAWIGSLLFVAWTTTVAASDLRYRRVANASIVAGLTAAFACAFTMRTPFGVAPAQAALGALLGLAALLPFFALRMMGAADVKVFAVLGAWCGPHALLDLWVVASILAGLHALALLLAARTRLAAPGRSGGATFGSRGRRATPYVTCLAVPALGMLALRQLGGA
ncbi:prepilin peptidase [Burkholderia sp. Ac-20365]|uniref:prepilin peptidase n=1 Tax=Burkholderia sp. Ac-20365 TaxID=2703897 RepID=UPI001F12136E|nr:prepilin peptidase [Burkholderia sp. Ac-20365]MBN3767925.1 prepilin peptidase [Burkholderia sp. Ac-20365]